MNYEIKSFVKIIKEMNLIDILIGMSYDLTSIPKINELLNNTNSRDELAKSLKLKYNIWKHDNGINYHIIKYNKEWLSKDLVETYGLLRSLIFKNDGKIVCFAPPKSLNTDNLEIDKSLEFMAERYIEGTMINVFYDDESNTWEIATKSNVGGKVCFFMEEGFKEENTFKKMFEEVCVKLNLDLNQLNKNYIYSFVMQHPRNRIVKIIREMKLYLVEVYKIENNTTINIINIKTAEDLNIPDSVELNDKIEIKNYYDLNLCKETLASMNTPYATVGVMIKNNKGQRYKFRNPNYEHVRNLRGNQPKLQYQYINLRKTGKVKEYLQYYKEHRKSFESFRSIIHDYTNELHNNYIRCYIKKEKELKEFPEKFRTHMYNLHHELYLKKLMPEKKYINKETVINYFNDLHPAKQMYVLNYDVRKNYKHSKLQSEMVE